MFLCKTLFRYIHTHILFTWPFKSVADRVTLTLNASVWTKNIFLQINSNSISKMRFIVFLPPSQDWWRFLCCIGFSLEHAPASVSRTLPGTLHPIPPAGGGSYGLQPSPWATVKLHRSTCQQGGITADSSFLPETSPILGRLGCHSQFCPQVPLISPCRWPLDISSTLTSEVTDSDAGYEK